MSQKWNKLSVVENSAINNSENTVSLNDSFVLRDQRYILALAADVADRPGTANDKISHLNTRIRVWAEIGNRIMAPGGERPLDILPDLDKIDGYVHTVDQRPIFAELEYFKLQDSVKAFKSDGKRTVNAFVSKAKKGMHQQLDIRWLSMAAWFDIDRAILDPDLAEKRLNEYKASIGLPTK